MPNIISTGQQKKNLNTFVVDYMEKSDEGRCTFTFAVRIPETVVNVSSSLVASALGVPVEAPGRNWKSKSLGRVTASFRGASLDGRCTDVGKWGVGD